MHMNEALLFPKPRPVLNHLKPYVAGKAIIEVEAMVPSSYHPILKMASNENPLGCSVSFEQLEKAYETIHYYPNHLTTNLVETLSDKFELDASHFILGNGSDEVILFMAMAYLNPSEEVITSESTFSEYAFATRVMGGELRLVPLKAWRHDLEAILLAITPKTKLIYLANPNNPTGDILTFTELSAFMARVPETCMVVLDEAYGEYVWHPDFPQPKGLITKFSNLVVLRTFSKLYGMAGFRLGYGMAQPQVIQTLKKVVAPFNINTLALVAGSFALKNTEFVEKTLLSNLEGKQSIEAELDKMGLKYLNSYANFILIQLPIPASVIVARLLGYGIIVRDLASFDLPYCLRVTIGLSDQNMRFIDALKRSLKE